jgi:hypothetical protein
MAVESFRPYVPGRAGSGSGWTLANYAELANASYAFYYWDTFRIGLIVSLLGVVFGAPIAWLAARTSSHGVRLFIFGLLIGLLFLSLIARLYAIQMAWGATGPMYWFGDLIGIPVRSPRYAEVQVIIGLLHFVLPLNALVVETAEGVADADLAPIGTFERDPVSVAERLLGRPHELGARSSVSTDCSGLVQQALLACGLPGPRRSDAQAELGRAVSAEAPARGDLVIWRAPDGDHDWTGHSALMIDAERLIHATGGKGVLIEPLAEVEARLTAEGFATAIFRRL